MGQEEEKIKEINQLTPREQEVAELIAWGASKKEIAHHLNVSVHTVESHTVNIYDKIGCDKATEISAWWFCTRFGISFSLAPSICRLIATCLLALFVSTNVVVHNANTLARRANRTSQTSRTGRRTRREREYILNLTV